MKIESVRVDGYGVLSDLVLDGLPGGLSVILGPNEAGKSTLLDFIRGVLFGFPDRRYKLPYHAPLRGGRHGGAIRLVDDHGERFLLERHTDQREPVLSRSDGTLASGGALGRILGNADDALFRSVFAFGLGELASFESLDRDEVREVVFSAGMLGAGRSATSAARALEAERSQLVRARQGDATANRLRRRLSDLDGDLHQARHDAAAYPNLLAERDRLAEETARARAAADAVQGRVGELGRITSLWPTFRDRADAVDALRGLGEPSGGELACLEVESQVRWLAESRSGHLERLQKQAEHAQTLSSTNASLDSLRLRIGLDELPRVPLALRDEIGVLAREAPDALYDLRDAERELKRTAEHAAERRRALALASAQAPPEASDVIRGRLGAIRQLATLLERAEHLEERARAKADEAELRRQLAVQRRGGADGAAVAVLLLAAAAALGAGLTDLAHGHGAGALVGAALGAVAAVLLVGVALRLRRNLRRDATVIDHREPDELVAAREAIARVTAAVGLDEPPLVAAVSPLLDSVTDQLSRRERAEALAAELEAAETVREVAAVRRDEAATRIANIDNVAQKLARELGFADGLSLDGLREALGELDEADKLRERIERVEKAAAALAPQVSGFATTLSDVEEKLGLAGGEDDVTKRVRILEELLEGVRQRTQRRDALEGRIARADALLAEGLGAGSDAERLGAELAGGEVTAWDAERVRLAEHKADADGRLERALGALRDAERALEELQSSADVARLELERASVLEELEATLDRWLVLGAAKTLLERGLARYERERQPEVVAHASRLFAEVTDGRYVHVLAHEDDEGRRRGVVAISASGERVDAGDLSRGTAEQLYLCLRLAFASTFAERSVPLPLVVDDVLVNFDPTRARAMARSFAAIAERHQMIVFTCHPHVAELFVEVAEGAPVFELAEG